MSNVPACPQCQSAYAYEDRGVYNCPECGHEWPLDGAGGEQGDPDALVVYDANGTQLQDGDTITVIKDLKVKGASSSLKVGTKVKGIRLVQGDHNIDCKIPGFGAMALRSEFVKKVQE